MGNELIDAIISAARQLRQQGVKGQLVAVLGLDVDDGGLGGVSTPDGEIKVFVRSGLVDPTAAEVMTEDDYFEMAVEAAHRGIEY